MYNNHNSKERKIISYILAILILVLPVLFILIWPTIGIITTLLGVIIWLSWNTFITKAAKKIHHLIYKEEME